MDEPFRSEVCVYHTTIEPQPSFFEQTFSVGGSKTKKNWFKNKKKARNLKREKNKFI